MDISKQFTSGQRYIALEPKIPRDMVMRAARLENDGFKTFKATTKSGSSDEVLPAGKCPAENANYKFYESLVTRRWQSFDEYITDTKCSGLLDLQRMRGKLILSVHVLFISKNACANTY